MKKRLDLVAIGVIAVVLVMVAAYARFYWSGAPVPGPGTGVSSLDIGFASPIYLPLVLRGYREPDRNFGIAEHTPGEAILLGLAGVDYVSGQWRLPLEGDTAVFLRPTERPHWSTWLLCSWSARDGWYDEEGCREWVREHPGTIFIVGNELTLGGSTGDGHWVDTIQYAQWYYEAWTLVKAEDSTATIAPYGPIQDTGGLLVAVWEAYREQYGEPLSADFYPVHFYCLVEDEPWWCWRKITHWVDWLERHRGTYWQGPCDYRLTEWGLRAWEVFVPEDVALALMEGMILELRDNAIGITQHAWWPHGNMSLVKDGRVTELGRLYYELSVGPIPLRVGRGVGGE